MKKKSGLYVTRMRKLRSSARRNAAAPVRRVKARTRVKPRAKKPVRALARVRTRVAKRAVRRVVKRVAKKRRVIRAGKPRVKRAQKRLTRNRRKGTVSKSTRSSVTRRVRKAKRVTTRKSPTKRSSMARRRSRKRNNKGHFVRSRKRATEAPTRKRRTVRRTRRRARAREEVAETPAPRRRRRRYARKNPWYGQPRRHRKAAKLGHTRRRRRHAARRRTRAIAAPRRRRARARTRTIVRTVYRRPRRHTRRRSRTSRAAVRRRHHDPGHFIGPLPEGMSESYALSNPLSAGELAFTVAVAGLGWLAANFVSRWANTTAVPVTAGTPSLVNGIPVGAVMANDVATLVMPGYLSIGLQALLAVGSGVGAHYSKSPMMKASLQGAMLGTGLHLFGEVATALLANLFKNTAMGQRLYLAEIEAREAGALPAAVAAGAAISNTGAGTFAQGATTVLGSAAAGGSGTLAGLPRGTAHPALGRHDPGPFARLQGVGQPNIQGGQPQQPGAVMQVGIPSTQAPVAVYGNPLNSQLANIAGNAGGGFGPGGAGGGFGPGGGAGAGGGGFAPGGGPGAGAFGQNNGPAPYGSWGAPMAPPTTSTFTTQAVQPPVAFAPPANTPCGPPAQAAQAAANHIADQSTGLAGLSQNMIFPD